jgi:ATP-dependent Lon protease
MKGKKGLTMTGQLGDVMKESAVAALSFIRTNAEALGIDRDFYEDVDLHIHVPSGAIPKDGPSAGVTILTALTSLLTNRTVKKDLAMTGEITLRGQVLPVGGIKERSWRRTGRTTRPSFCPGGTRRTWRTSPPGSARTSISGSWTT